MRKNYLPEVRNQYENLPYPQRDPQDEKTRLLKTNLDDLLKISHNCFKGRAQFSKNFRVLVAGGGTGDALIYLAEQLRHTNASVTYLDLSSASMAIAKERAEIRGLKNITWRQESILDLQPGSHGAFDYINCSGVLHHLESPVEGLLSLKSVLTPGGAMGLMVYAKYGRTAVYQMQDLMKLVNGDTQDIDLKVSNANKILNDLPKSNWLSKSDDLHSDHKRYGDIGVFDLFLHTKDRAYSIPELMEWLDECGLKFIDFADNKTKYEPRNYIMDETLRQDVESRPKNEQYAIAELLTADIIKHSFYCGFSENMGATLSDLSYPKLVDEFLYQDILDRINTSYLGRVYPLVRNGKTQLEIPVTILTVEFFKRMNGRLTVGKIRKKMEKLQPDTVQNRKEVRKVVHDIIRALVEIGEMSLCKAASKGR